jgi:uncharacterized cupin superfamily protein
MLQTETADVERFPLFTVRDDLLATARRFAPYGPTGPNMRNVEAIRSQDGRVASGIWDCTAGVFEVDLANDEVVYILEGEVHVIWNDSVQTLRPGDIAYLPAGHATTWVVPDYVRKVWFHHSPKRSLKRRVASKLRTWSERLLKMGEGEREQ